MRKWSIRKIPIDGKTVSPTVSQARNTKNGIFFFLTERPSPGAYGAPDSAFPFRWLLVFYTNGESLALFKSPLGAKAHTFAADNAFFFINLRQGIYIPLRNSALGTNRYRGASMVLRALLRVYGDFHAVSSPWSWQYSFLMASINASTRSSWIQ